MFQVALVEAQRAPGARHRSQDSAIDKHTVPHDAVHDIAGFRMTSKVEEQWGMKSQPRLPRSDPTFSKLQADINSLTQPSNITSTIAPCLRYIQQAIKPRHEYRCRIRCKTMDLESYHRRCMGASR
jgi:hypothetical protein